jgi:hypothetical protein
MTNVLLISKCAYPESPSYQKRILVGAASSRDHLISRLEAAGTTNSTCSFQITAFQNFTDLFNFL